jgi:hypothetical protein
MKNQRIKKGDRVALMEGVPLYGFQSGDKGTVAFITPEGPIAVCFDTPRKGSTLGGVCKANSGMVCLELDLHKI